MQAIWRTVRARSEQILDWVMLTIIAALVVRLLW
jgi:hypothetical protein